MILTRIQIENYKQYQGSHDFDVPAQATVGVIGENGAGKTTLFEAIEWCLYAPRSIAASDVRPRGFTGHTTVMVHLETADGSQQFIVERVLKRVPTATIYRVDQSGDIVPIVQGTRQVSDYVTTKLIGLSHTAFTATFFTRQKELHLFGDQAPGKRREEVGRLLGLETIRTAQRSILAERTQASNEARAMLVQYERESNGRDFTAELAEADTAISSCTEQLKVDADLIAKVEQRRIAAEAAVAAAQERREQDVTLGQHIGQHRQEHHGLGIRIAQLTTELERLDAREKVRAQLVPVAIRHAELTEQITRQEAERARFEQCNELERTLRDGAQRNRELNATIRDLVAQIRLSSPIDGWLWSTDDTLNAPAGATRLLRIIDDCDLPGAELRQQRLNAVIQASAAHINALETLGKYREARRKLDVEEATHLVNGEPKDRLPKLDKEREDLLHQRTMLDANRTNLESERDKARTIFVNLERKQFGDDCPTCGRPFSEEDAVVVTEAMRLRVDGMTSSIDQLKNDSDAIIGQLAAIEESRKQVHEEMKELDVVRKRIQKSMNFLESQETAVGDCEAALATALKAASLDAPPLPGDIARADRVTTELRQLKGARVSIASVRESFVTLETRVKEATSARNQLGEVSFDPASFKRLQAEHQESGKAQAAIDQIDHDIARRPDLETELSAASARIVELEGQLAILEKQRSDIGFDMADLATARTTLQEVQNAERTASQRFHQNTTALRETEIRREVIEREQLRLAKLAKSADAKRFEADNLDLFAKEFTEFERYAAGKKRPILAQYTSQLVSSITDGKYEHVDFDPDFGIVVYDGDDAESSFAVDTFSGGERDAITLAARIALSQMIGHQAVNPPGFLVLDEVFGSLDTDRRAHLLNLLGSISSTFEDLRQVFIISHVDDVRTSPVLDELWRVEENDEGSSSMTSLPAGAEVETL